MAKVRIKQLEDIQASDIYLERDLKVTTKVGEIKSFDAGKQYATVSATRQDGSRKTVQDVLEEIFSRDDIPVPVLPAATLEVRLAAGAAPIASRTLCEAGSFIDVIPSATLSAGSYPYGPATGIVATGTLFEVVRTDSKGNETVDMQLASGQRENYLIPVRGCSGIHVRALVDYPDAAATALSRLGNATGVRIAAGRATALSPTIVPALPIFFGAGDNEILVDTNYRDLLDRHLVDPATSEPFTLRISPSSSDLMVCLALPKSLGAHFTAALASSMGADITANFSLKTTLTVATADGADQLDAYDFYLFEPSAFQGNEVIDITIMR